MVDMVRLRTLNRQRWQGCKIKDEMLAKVTRVANQLVASKERYHAVSEKTGVPWPVVAVIHERESSQSWKASLAQGDPWNAVSIHVPKGRGPFTSWEAAAIDALVNCAPHASSWQWYDIGGALTLLESYNGLGYASMNLPSPYVWASTNQYFRGKYTADGHFDYDAEDHQLGCAALLKQMTELDATIANEWHPD